MFAEILLFYREVVIRAFRGKFWLVEKWTGGLALLCFVAAKLLSPSARVAEVIEVSLPLYFFLVLLSAVIILGIIISPVEMFGEERKRRQEAEEQLKPKIRVSVSESSGRDFHTGTTSQSADGSRQTLLKPVASNSVALIVRNDGGQRIDRCIAELISAECIEGETVGRLDILEPITLCWGRDGDQEKLSASLESGASARVWIASVHYGGFVWLFRNTKSLPAEYQRIFGSSGRYRAVIQVSDGRTLSVQTMVEIIGSKGDPTGSYPSGTGKSSIYILEQASPRL